MEKFINYIQTKEFIESLVVVLISIVLLKITKALLIKKAAYMDDNFEGEIKSIRGIIFGLLQYGICIVSIFIILTVNNVDISAQLAGLGILATVVGLSLQDSINDVIQGIIIYNNNFYKVNDIVKYNGKYCIVKFFNIRVTKFMDLDSNSTYTVRNSKINEIEKVKNNFATDLTFKFEDKYDVIMKCLNEIVDKINAFDEIENTLAVGCVKIDYYGKHFAIAYNIKPIDYFNNICRINEVILKTIEKYDITLVTEKYNHEQIH